MTHEDIYTRMAAAWPGIEEHMLRDGQADPAGERSMPYQLFLDVRQAILVEVDDLPDPNDAPEPGYLLHFDEHR